MSTKLGEISGNRESQALCVALFNLQGVNAFRLAHSNNDTEFTYGIYSEQKLTKLKVQLVETFIHGFKAAVQVYN